MLRIERDESRPDRTTLRLAGRLGSAEIGTLVESVDPLLGARRTLDLDLGALRFLDEEAARLLLRLRSRGATLTRAGGYVAELLDAVEGLP